MKKLNLLFAILLATSVGCTSSDETNTIAINPSIDSSKYVLNNEPDGAISVTEARENSKDQDDIVMVGRIGGGSQAFIDNRAAFMVIDASMVVVADGEDSSETEVCMDDCCASVRAACTMLVKIVDEQGKPLAIDARTLLNAQVNDMVVIQGKVQRNDEQGLFAVAANGVYLRR